MEIDFSTQINDVILAIQDGKLDEFLGELNGEIYSRMTVLQSRKARETRQQLEVGTKVRLGNRMKPQYLSNRAGEVVEFKNSRILVKLDCGPIGKFRTGRVLCPLTALEVIQ